MQDRSPPAGLSGQTVLVTGASREIGAETARLLARRGAWIFVNYRDKDKRAESVVDDIVTGRGRATAMKADITDPATPFTSVVLTTSPSARLPVMAWR
jgi:3-oxoacyl-[acyl-carrier protein] reductase